MNEIFSIDGLDSHIYKFLTFKDLLLLRQVSKLNREVISTFSLMIFKKLIHNFNSVTIDPDTDTDMQSLATVVPATVPYRPSCPWPLPRSEAYRLPFGRK